MFNQNGYSLADISAATNNNNGWGNCEWWIFMLFILCGFGGWNNGYGNTRSDITQGFDTANLQRGIVSLGNGLSDGFYAMNTGLLNGFANTQAATSQGIADLNATLTNGTRDLQNSIQAKQISDMQALNGVTLQLHNMAADEATHACATQRQLDADFAQLNYNLATEGCQLRQAINNGARDIIENNNNGVKAILDFLVNDKIATLQAENQNLRSTLSQNQQNAFLISQLRPSPAPAYIVQNPYASGNTGYCPCQMAA